MRLTRKEALILVRDMWQWILEKPFRRKRDWPGWKKHRSAYAPFCACCFYVDYRNSINENEYPCDRCPLLFLWPEGCVEFDGPYEGWREAKKNRDIRAYKRYARIIRDAAIGELEDMG